MGIRRAQGKDFSPLGDSELLVPIWALLVLVLKLYLLLLTLCSSGQDGSFLVKAKSVHLLFRLILGHYLRDSFEITWDSHMSTKLA